MPDAGRPASQDTGRLIANLCWESELAGESPGRRARDTAAAFGTLLRAFARPGDTLHLEAPIPAERLPSVPWLPSPRLEHGALSGLPAASRILAWAESSAVAVSRPRAGAGGNHHPTSSSLVERLWQAEASFPKSAAALHHREFFFTLAGQLGTRLPGSVLVSSLGELELGLRDPHLARSEWVLKAPWSAAGRQRVLGHGRDPEPAIRSAVSRLLGRQHPLLLEPWVDRMLDFGVCLLVRKDGAEIVTCHRQLIDSRGVFRGLELAPAKTLGLWLPEAQAAEVEEVTTAAGRAAAAAGYRGPLGVDGFLYRTADGLRCQPLGEINARMTFGLIGRALAEALPETLWRDDELCRLRLGSGLPGSGPPGSGLPGSGQLEPEDAVDSRRRIHLLRPGVGAPGAAWIEFVPRNRPLMKL